MPIVPIRATLAVAFALLLRTGAHAAETEPAAPRAAAPKAASLEPAGSDDAAAKAVKDHFRSALALIESKQYEKATAELQKAIALKPNSRLIADLYQLAVARFLDAAMESSDPKLKAAAERLQKMAFKGRLAQLRDPEVMKKLVKDLAADDFYPRTMAMQELIIAGDYAVPYLVKFLIEDTNTEHRAYTEYVLSRFSGTAVPPICEALKHDDPMIRQILAQTLEAIGDPRAIPSLLWLAQAPDGHPLVVASAKRALGKITDDAAVLSKPAPVAFLDLAQDYYYQNQRVLLPHLYEHLVWRWDSDKKELTSKSVPRPIYPYRMAEEACRNALLADRRFEPAIPLLICAFFAQQNLLESFHTAAEGKQLTDEEKQDIELAEPIRQRLRVAPLIAYAAGRKFIYAALQRALRDGRSDVAISCIGALRQIADGSALPRPLTPEEVRRQKRGRKKKTTTPKPRKAIMTWYGPKDRVPEGPPPEPVSRWALPLDGTPLVMALGHPNKHVRYAAANALVAIAPPHVIRDADRVIYNLAEAISETATRVALLVDEDNESIDKMRGLLRDAGVFPELARGERDALSLAQQLPPKDLIIMNGQLQAANAPKLLAKLRQVYTLATAPALIIVDKDKLPKLREAFPKENVAFITRPFSEASVRAAIDRVLAKAAKPRGTVPVTAMSATAAASLASIDPGTSTFKLADALPALRRAVASNTQPDSVRIPACKAIGRVGSPGAAAELVAAYKSPKSSKPLRLATLAAMGACSARGAMRKDVAAVVHAASHDPDFDFRRAAALAFGLSGGASAQIIKVGDQLHGIAPK